MQSADDVRHLVTGPADYFDDNAPPSRGQWKDIALLALGLIDGVEIPRTRFEATTAIVRLRHAHEHVAAGTSRATIPEQPW